MSILPFRKGFTLAELLIALAILGVIATFTIPKVLSTQADQKKRAVFKETLAAISQIHYQWFLEGNTYTTHADYRQYAFDHLNAIKLCPNSAYAEGCSDDSGWTTPVAMLASGASIEIFGGSAFDYTIDYNGIDEPNTDGEDKLLVFAPYDDSYCGVKPGAVGFAEDACSGTWPEFSAWKALYEWIYAQ